MKPFFVPRRFLWNSFGVELRHDHRDVGRPAVGGVVGDDRDFGLGVGFLERLDFVLFHVYGAEDEIDERLYLVDSGRVHDDHIFNRFGHGHGELPPAAESFFVGLACRARACDERGDFEIGVLL